MTEEEAGQWRFLEEGETILVTDEIYSELLREWIPVNASVGNKAPCSYYGTSRVFRRRVPSEVTP